MRVALAADAGCAKSAYAELRKLYTEFKMEDAQHVKEIESVTNHDVKAVEYLLKEKLEELGLNDYREFVHFGLTSQDINNTATPLLLKEAIAEVYRFGGSYREVAWHGNRLAGCAHVGSHPWSARITHPSG